MVSILGNDRCDLLCLDLPKAESLRAARLPEASARLLAERAKALGDPTRLTLALALAGTDELCVCDLAWISERAENLVSHHLRKLRSAGLVASRRQGKMVMYSVTEAGRLLLHAVRAEARCGMSSSPLRSRPCPKPRRRTGARRMSTRSEYRAPRQPRRSCCPG
ncbi:MAG: metalloregulator ArsR/SmtB family transcription factor [Thermoleophilaceae bacterium]